MYDVRTIAVKVGRLLLNPQSRGLVEIDVGHIVGVGHLGQGGVVQ